MYYSIDMSAQGAKTWAEHPGNHRVKNLKMTQNFLFTLPGPKNFPGTRLSICLLKLIQFKIGPTVGPRVENKRSGMLN